MNILIKALGILGQGLMLGIGIMIAVWGVHFGSAYLGKSAPDSPSMSFISDSDSDSDPNPDSVLITPRTAKNFGFRDVEEIRQGDKTYFIGIVKNRDKFRASSIHIEVNLFKNGKFVDQYSSYLSGVIEPDEERYFKISCGCKDNPVAEHDSYKISVLSGY